MTRHFGLTRPVASTGGAHPLPASHSAHDTQRDSIPFPSGSLFESRDVSDPSVDERELGACCFFLALLSLVGFVLLVGYVGLQSFVLEPVEYQRGMKTN